MNVMNVALTPVPQPHCSLMILIITPVSFSSNHHYCHYTYML